MNFDGFTLALHACVAWSSAMGSITLSGIMIITLGFYNVSLFLRGRFATFWPGKFQPHMLTMADKGGYIFKVKEGYFLNAWDLTRLVPKARRITIAK